MNALDAVVVGSGPNGLAAAITLARAGRSVRVFEASDRPGGGARTAELTLPGFRHDVCSAIHPFGAGSPFFRSLDLERHGLRWLHPEVALAHPLDGGGAGAVWQDIDRTVEHLGADGSPWRRHIGFLARHWDQLAPMLLAPLTRVPRHPVVLTRFGLPALAPSRWIESNWFDTDEAQALFAGCAAHAFLPLSRPFTASFGLVLLAAAHAVGWPVASGGSESITDALVAELLASGGTIETGRRVRTLGELPSSTVVLFDVAPRELAAIADDRLPWRYRRRLLRYRHGPAAFKIDYALDGPVPWTNDLCHRAGTVHVAGTAAEVQCSELDVARGRHPDRPYVLVGQQSIVDPLRAPDGKHTLWAYCHVPARSDVDMTEAIEAQIERFAPGFRDLVLARHVAGPAWLEAYNPSYVGGDITGGANTGLQPVFRPMISRHPYQTPDPALLLCSAATPPGAGVHGMCGFNAAQAALRGSLR